MLILKVLFRFYYSLCNKKANLATNIKKITEDIQRQFMCSGEGEAI